MDRICRREIVGLRGFDQVFPLSREDLECFLEKLSVVGLADPI